MVALSLDKLEAFYQGRKVFVTGHTGFKGAWLCMWLIHLGAEVTGYSLEAPTEPNLFGVLGLAEKMTSIMGDVRDYSKLRDEMKKCCPEVVIHMAAQSLVRLSYKEPRLTYETNVMGTVNILEACRYVSSVGAVINVTSDKCYENSGKVEGYREEDPKGGYDPYSSSKACSELVTSAYVRSFFSPGMEDSSGFACASARSGNVIGGGDWSKDRLVPDAIRAFSQGKPFLVRYPDAIRPWQHVLDPLSGYLLLAKQLYMRGAEFSGGWNFGPDIKSAKPVRWIAEKVIQHWGEGAEWGTDDEDKPYEAAILKLDISKARDYLKWKGSVGLEDAMKWTVEWYLAHLEGRDMFEETLTQIKAYEKRIG